jgi:hypothetical protein
MLTTSDSIFWILKPHISKSKNCFGKKKITMPPASPPPGTQKLPGGGGGGAGCRLHGAFFFF